MHCFGMSVEYDRLLRMESQIATSVSKRMLDKDSIYLPSWGDASSFSQASSSATIHRLFYIRNKERAAAYITETSLPDAAWLLGRRLLKVSPGTTRSEEQPADEETSQENIPTWSGYNSLVSQNLPPSQGCHGTTACCSSTRPTLLTILVQTHGINDIVVGL